MSRSSRTTLEFAGRRARQECRPDRLSQDNARHRERLRDVLQRRRVARYNRCATSHAKAARRTCRHGLILSCIGDIDESAHTDCEWGRARRTTPAGWSTVRRCWSCSAMSPPSCASAPTATRGCSAPTTPSSSWRRCAPATSSRPKGRSRAGARTSLGMEFVARKVIVPTPRRDDTFESSADLLAEPIVVCRARGTCVVPGRTCAAPTSSGGRGRASSPRPSSAPRRRARRTRTCRSPPTSWPRRPSAASRRAPR